MCVIPSFLFFFLLSVRTAPAKLPSIIFTPWGFAAPLPTNRSQSAQPVITEAGDRGLKRTSLSLQRLRQSFTLLSSTTTIITNTACYKTTQNHLKLQNLKPLRPEEVKRLQELKEQTQFYFHSWFISVQTGYSRFLKQNLVKIQCFLNKVTSSNNDMSQGR